MAPNQVLLDFDDLPLGTAGTFTYHGLLFKNAAVVQAADGGKEILFLGDGNNSGIFASGNVKLVEYDFHDGDGVSTAIPIVNGAAEPTIPSDYQEHFIGHVVANVDHFTKMYFSANFAGTAYAHVDNLILQYDSGFIV